MISPLRAQCDESRTLLSNVPLRDNITSCPRFLSSLLPPTPEMVQHVLTQGGFPSDANPVFPRYGRVNPDIRGVHHPDASNPSRPLHNQDPQFKALLDETRDILLSSDFYCVLEMCLDRATDILFSDLEDTVFEPSESPAEAVRIRLAELLPKLASWSESALNGLPNELVDVSLSFLFSAITLIY